MNSNKKELLAKQPRSERFALQRGRREELLKALRARFEKNMNRHKGLDWAKVQARLEPDANPERAPRLRDRAHREVRAARATVILAPGGVSIPAGQANSPGH